MTGRYLTPDPIGLEGGINPFLYAYNDPINLMDPEGLRYRRPIRWHPPEPVNPMPGRKYPAFDELPDPSHPGYKNPLLPDPRYETICYKWECKDPDTCKTTTGPWLTKPGGWHPSKDINCKCLHWGWKYP